MDQFEWANQRLSLTPRAYAWRWVLSLILLTLLALGDQAMVQYHLLSQQADAGQLNLAGRQRGLALTLQREAQALLGGTAEPRAALGRMEQAQAEWEAGFKTLARDGGSSALPSPEVRAHLATLEPSRQAMGQALAGLQPLAQTPPGQEMRRQAERLLAAGDDFLPLMDRLVHVLEDEAVSRVQKLRRLELVLAGGFLLVLLAMALFLFIPLGRRLRQDLDLLTTAAQEMHDLTLQDGLTGVANRRHLEERLGVEWRRAGRNGQPLSLVILDIDHFKDYNAAHGHQAGDLALVKVAGAAAWAARRAGDLTARQGGEEFVLLLPHTPVDGALSLAEQLRQQVRSLELGHPASPVAGIVTVSLGVACFAPVSGQVPVSDQPAQLLEAADRSLRRAKQSGRDRVGPPMELK